MLKEVAIKKYGELEFVYIHIEPYMDNQWYCTVSLVHPSNTRMHGMFYPRNPRNPNDINKAIKKYYAFLENYWWVG